MKIGILTSGGDCPGLNAVIRGVVLKGTTSYDLEFVGIRDGWRGVVDGDFFPLTRHEVKGLSKVGGTILGTSRTNPYEGPRGGAENITKGFHSVAWGFAAIVAFMGVYYMLFGLISGISLAVNLLLLVAILSMLQATLTLPGMAAMALTLGMAIDANVLVNERVREELRGGASPQAAIHAGYDRAWATILDSNVTTLIVGVILLLFGSGPVQGFAVVHCLGILTSIFSSVVVSRAVINLIYGGKKKLTSLSIGQVWKPAN